MELGWNIFPYIALVVVALSLSGALLSISTKEHKGKGAIALSTLGVFAMACFIAMLWLTLDRPPLRTMGETRLWYSFFLLLAGLFTYIRWRYRWIMSFSTMLATVFIIINIARPEIHDETLMPALQSGWFVPHVAVYMFSYALLGCATLLAVWSIFRPDNRTDDAIDRLLYGGIAFFTIGMLTGSLWAKEAWGAYWSWDAKEAWAAATWGLYLLAIHLPGRLNRARYGVIIVAFVALQMCWWGVNYLPSAQTSEHTYTQSRE